MPESTGTDGQASADHADATRQARAVLHPHHGPGPLAAIGVGGTLGTLARYAFERSVVADPSGIPWATLSVNVIGSTFAVEIDQRIRHGHSGAAAAYLAASLLAGLGAALAGITLARGRVLPAPGGPGPVDPDLLAGDDPGEAAPRTTGPGDAS